MILSTPFIAFAAPLLLLYLIQIFRVLENSVSHFEGARPRTVGIDFSLTRDALLVTATSDLLFIVSSFPVDGAFYRGATMTEITLGLALLFAHISIFIFYGHWYRRSADRLERSDTSRRFPHLLLHLYASVLVLMTNPFTMLFLFSPWTLRY
jgi:hypothetical protein